MTAAQVQNALILCLIFGFGMMEFLSRRQRAVIQSSKDDTTLEVLMFLSVVAVTQPLAILTTSKLGNLWFPEYKDALADLPWWGMVAILLVADDMRSTGGTVSRIRPCCGPCTVRTIRPST
jgi:hypothetical protein